MVAARLRGEVEVVVLAPARGGRLVAQHLARGRHPRRPRLRRLLRPQRPHPPVARRAPPQHRQHLRRELLYHRLVPHTHPPPRRRVVHHPKLLHPRRRREVVDQRRRQVLHVQPLRPARPDGERVVPHLAQIHFPAPPERLLVAVRQPRPQRPIRVEVHHPVHRRSRGGGAHDVLARRERDRPAAQLDGEGGAGEGGGRVAAHPEGHGDAVDAQAVVEAAALERFR